MGIKQFVVILNNNTNSLVLYMHTILCHIDYVDMLPALAICRFKQSFYLYQVIIYLTT